MNIWKILTVLCGMSLALTILFAVSTRAALKETISEADRARENAESVLAKLRKESETVDSVPTQATPLDPLDTTAGSAGQTPAAKPSGQVFFLRSCDGRIGVFTKEGYLMRTLDVDVRTLPSADRAALESGIRVESWNELVARIEDFER